MNYPRNTNTVIMASIPLRKDFKSYYLRKWRLMCERNGEQFASQIFKKAREVILEYRSDPSRVKNFDKHYRRMPLRKNGWLRAMFRYADTHPQAVLSFLKLYTAIPEPLVTVDQSSGNQHRYLSSEVKVDTSVPRFLRDWLDLIRSTQLSRRQYESIKNGEYLVAQLFLPVGQAKRFNRTAQLIRKYAKWHTYEEYLRYHKKWSAILDYRKVDMTTSVEHMLNATPLPEVYKDFANTGNRSLEHDLFQLLNLGVNEFGPLSPAAIKFVHFGLRPELLFMFDQLQDGTLRPNENVSFLIGETVGEIQHIPKKGTTERRPIAVPNRFIQMGMQPVYEHIKGIVQRLPQDCTFDQNKFDRKISFRVSNSDLFVGSVDLSKATDNLPLDWGVCIIERLGFSNEIVEESWELFKEVARAPWDNNGYVTSWQHGQPLGTLPSFMVLAVTHNLFLESLAFSEGYGHSPYSVLGDDVIIFTKRLYKAYIRQMRKRNVPLSLHKSFSGNLTEFAGKTFVKNMSPFYVSDHGPITWESLFDWQRSTGIWIPYRNLPVAIRKKMHERTKQAGYKSKYIERSYDLILRGYVMTRGSFSIIDTSLVQTLWYKISSFDDPAIPDPLEHSGTFLLFGRPLTYGDVGYAPHRGFLKRYRQVQSNWFNTKYRPVATDLVLRAALSTVTESLN